MKKIIFIFVITLGFCIIGLGIFLQINESNSSNQSETKEENKFQTFERINKYNLPEVCSIYDTISTYINTSDYQKINFNYPNCVHEYQLNFWNKMLQNEDKSVEIEVVALRQSADNYMDQQKTYAISLKNEHNYDVEHTEVIKTTSQNNFNVYLMEINYQWQSPYTTYSYDIWNIAIELEENFLLTIEVSSKDKIISYKAIEELFNSVTVEKDAAIFSHSVIDGNYQVGTIKSNFYNSFEHGYKINYKMPIKYPEIDSFTSNINSAIFSYEELILNENSQNIHKKVYLSLTVEYDFYDNFKQMVETSKNISIQPYNQDNETYRNIKDTGIIESKINDKNVYYFIYTYDYYLDNKKMNTNYLSRVFYEIEPQIYVELWIDNQEVEVNENFIRDVYNFTMEEY